MTEIEQLKAENAKLKGDIYRLTAYYENLKHNMNNVCGHTFAKEMVDRSEMEYAVQETNKILEKRNWD